MKPNKMKPTKLSRSLYIKLGGRLYLKDTNDWLLLLTSDGMYPQTVIAEAANHVCVRFKQVAPNLYWPIGLAVKP